MSVGRCLVEISQQGPELICKLEDTEVCGFAGYINLRNNPKVELATLQRMTETLVHRGPDSSGYFLADDVGFGFRRLSIIDPAGGDQPLYNEDGSIVLACN